MNEYKNKDLIRRRFYLSEESLAFLDSKAAECGVSGSLFLDDLLMLLKRHTWLSIVASTEPLDETSPPHQ